MADPTPPAAGPDVKQARIKEFLAVLPVTLAIAGLPDCHPDRLFTADQMEARLLSLRTAYKLARGYLREVGDG